MENHRLRLSEDKLGLTCDCHTGHSNISKGTFQKGEKMSQTWEKSKADLRERYAKDVLNFFQNYANAYEFADYILAQIQALRDENAKLVSRLKTYEPVEGECACCGRDAENDGFCKECKKSFDKNMKTIMTFVEQEAEYRKQIKGLTEKNAKLKEMLEITRSALDCAERALVIDDASKIICNAFSALKERKGEE